MPEFVLNTAEGDKSPLPKFHSLPDFVQGYIEAMFFTDTNELYERDEFDLPEVQEAIAEGRVGGEIPKDSGYADLDDKDLHDIIGDCKAFAEGDTETAMLLAEAYATDNYDEQRAGNDFWYTRNGHGTGFWDRGLGEVGDRLAKRARKFGDVYVYWGDDSKVHHD